LRDFAASASIKRRAAAPTVNNENALGKNGAIKARRRARAFARAGNTLFNLPGI